MTRRTASAPACRRCATGCRRTFAAARPDPPSRRSRSCRRTSAHEWAAEVANRTVHGLAHIGWVPDGAGGYRGEMAVYVRANGLLGRAYLAAIRPFRYLVVYR